MVTNYTTDITLDTPFEKFVLRCARAMGPCAHQRDQGIDVLPRLRKASESPQEVFDFETLELELERLKSLTPEEFARQRKEDWIDRVREHFAENRRRFALQTSYEAMIEKVVSWDTGDADYEDLRNFMLGQLLDSIRHDCAVFDFPYIDTRDPKEALGEEISQVKITLGLSRVEASNERAAVAKANVWISGLYKVLGVDMETSDKESEKEHEESGGVCSEGEDAAGTETVHGGEGQRSTR